MIRYAFIASILLLSVNLKAQSQRGGVNVGINTEKPTETLYLPEDYDKNWLDINGDLRVRDIPDFTKARTHLLNEDGSEKTNKVRRLYRDFISGSLETVEYKNAQKPIYAIQYRINSKAQTDKYSHWRYFLIQDFDTKINAKKYQAFVIHYVVMGNPSFANAASREGKQHIGLYKDDLVYTAVLNANGFHSYETPFRTYNEDDRKRSELTEFDPIEDVRMYVKNGTWHISADTYHSRPKEILPHTYVFTVIAINNNYSNRIRVPGSPNENPLKNIIIGDKDNNETDPNPGHAVRRRGNDVFGNIPYGSLDRNPIDEQNWIIPSETPRNDKHAYEY